MWKKILKLFAIVALGIVVYTQVQDASFATAIEAKVPMGKQLVPGAAAALVGVGLGMILFRG